jgi:hypothetical protein
MSKINMLRRNLVLQAVIAPGVQRARRMGEPQEQQLAKTGTSTLTQSFRIPLARRSRRSEFRNADRYESAIRSSIADTSLGTFHS